MEKERSVFHYYLRGLILAGMTLILFKLAVSGELKYYLSPKLFRYTYAAIAILGVLSLIQLSNSPKHAHGHSPGSCCETCHNHPLPKRGLRSVFYYSLFIIPILTGFVLPAHILGSDVAVNRQIKQGQSFSAASGSEKLSASSRAQTGGRQKSPGAAGEPLTQKQFDTLKQNLLRQKTIRIDNNDDFVYILNIIGQEPNWFKGKQLEMTGFVYRDKSIGANQMVAARYVITCCIADAAVYGMVTKGHVAGLSKDSWVRISGTLDSFKHNGSVIPVLNLTKYTKISPPDKPYVYDNGVRL